MKLLRGQLLSTLVTLVTWSGVAAADRGTCIKAADEGQRLRDEGKFLDAREQFISCAMKECPALVAKECVRWLEEIDRDMPTATFRVRDEHGKEIVGARVMVDGELVPETSSSILLDPGEHKSRFARPDGSVVEEVFVLRPAEKNRVIELTFPKAPEPPPARAVPLSNTQRGTEKATQPPRKPFTMPAAAWIGAGAAVAGAAVTIVFALKANSSDSDLRATCAPRCSSDQTRPVEREIIVANIGLGVSIVGLGVAIVTTILANAPARAGATASTWSHGTQRNGLAVTFTSNGGSLGGSF